MTDEATREAAWLHRGDDYLAKPFGADELLEPVLGPGRCTSAADHADPESGTAAADTGGLGVPDRSTLMATLLPIAVRIDELWTDSVEARDMALSSHLLEAKRCLNRALELAQPSATPLVSLAVRPVVPATAPEADWGARVASMLRHPSSHSVPTARPTLKVVRDDRARVPTERPVTVSDKTPSPKHW